MSRGTPHRKVRVPDELWRRALARAQMEGTSVSAVLVKALREWVDAPDAPEVTIDTTRATVGWS